jgi:hypothetical protein
MSTSFVSSNEQTQLQALKVQELYIAGSDTGMYVISGGNTFVLVNDPLLQIYSGSVKVDSSNLVTQFQNASLVICDSVALTAGGNASAIELVGLSAVAPLDVITVRYQVQS